MNRPSALFLLLVLVPVLFLPPVVAARGVRLTVTERQPLPVPISNNAVASLNLKGKPVLFSFLGLGPSKLFDGITREAFRYDVSRNEWTRIRSVPGPVGRLAATAQGVNGKVYLFGGYTVDSRANEVSLPNLDIYDPKTDTYTAGAPIPVPVDDAVSGVWRNRLIYLVSGWSQKDNVNLVQVYDPKKNEWKQATPIPGPPVFGHAGAIVGDTLVFCNGVRVDPSKKPRFVASGQCFRGDIDPKNPTRIAWRALPPRPAFTGTATYRMAAGPLKKKGWVVFSGGTDNPYNYDGVGYDGRPSRPSGITFAFDVKRNEWVDIAGDSPLPTMDHRGLVGDDGALFLIGGLGPGGEVVPSVRRLDF